MSDFWNAFWAHLFSVENAETLAEVISIIGLITFGAIIVMMIGTVTMGILEYMASREDK